MVHKVKYLYSKSIESTNSNLHDFLKKTHGNLAPRISKHTDRIYNYYKSLENNLATDALPTASAEYKNFVDDLKKIHLGKLDADAFSKRLKNQTNGDLFNFCISAVLVVLAVRGIQLWFDLNLTRLPVSFVVLASALTFGFLALQNNLLSDESAERIQKSKLKLLFFVSHQDRSQIQDSSSRVTLEESNFFEGKLQNDSMLY